MEITKIQLTRYWYISDYSAEGLLKKQTLSQPAEDALKSDCGYCRGSGEMGIGMRCDVCKGAYQITVFHEEVECITCNN